MDVIRLAIPEVFLVKPQRRGDDRGFFVETYKAAALAELGVTHPFVQDNMSLSREVGTLRGLHFQSPPHAQAKLVSCLQGRIYDVAVDARKGSPTYGQHATFQLSADKANSVYIPKGMAHGFCALSDEAIMVYKVSTVYAPHNDAGVRWDSAGIAWPTASPIISDRDAGFAGFGQFDSPFTYE